VALAPGGPAQKAGIKTADVIVMFDGKDITTDDELRSAILARKPGDQVTVVVVRANGSRTTLTATLGVRPVNP
jgi:S1-C subfamily serine protease